MASIISNKDQVLQKVLADSLIDAEKVDIAVGYFYLSGFRALANELKDKHVRIVVGMEIDPDCIVEMVNYIKNADDYLDAWQPRKPTRSAIALRQNYIDSLIGLANDSDMLENSEVEQAFDIFMQKIENGSLEIRKTLKRYHGKMYLVYKKPKIGDNSIENVAFMGSSNMTYSGLSGQGELNKSLNDQRDKEDFSKLEKEFADLWSAAKSINIVDKHNKTEFLAKLKTKISKYQTPTPYEMYARVLYELFHSEDNQTIKSPSQITDRRFMDLEYQLDAIREGLDKLKRYDGLIVADVVGLGKSIIAACIARNLDIKTVIIAPPHLVSQWEDYKEQFGIRGSIVFSSGKIKDVFQRYQVSERPILFIIDEAHRYRNEETNDYKLLHQVCRSHKDNKILLITATPFNNTPQDIFALVRLFQTPGLATIRSVDNLSFRFRDLIERYKKLRSQIRQNKSEAVDQNIEASFIAKETKRLIENIVIRRSRLDLTYGKYAQDLKSQGIELPEVSDPEIIEYNLEELSSLYIETLYKISGGEDGTGLIGTRYKPILYIKDLPAFFKNIEKKFNRSDLQFMRARLKITQVNLADFMRRLLVRRFESSKDAFRTTLKKMIDGNHSIERLWKEDGQIAIMDRRKIPDKDDDRNYEPEDGEDYDDFDPAGEDLVVDKQKIYIPKTMLKESFIDDLRRDTKLLEDIYSNWFEDEGVAELDPKRDDLAKHLKAMLNKEPGRKIIIFSSYADTIHYLEKALKKHNINRVLAYTSDSSSAKKHRIIQANFDASYPADQQANDYDILLTTDAMSEGYNLHQAGTVINYDIPYNPTRVIQRIGRINRIGKKRFDKLKIMNWFPTATGEAETNIKKISTMKIKLFNEIIGNDTKILTDDEKLESVLGEIVSAVNEKEEQESWHTVHRDEYSRMAKNTQFMAKVKGIPRKTRILRKDQSLAGIVVFGKKGEQSVFTWATADDKPKIIGIEEALKFFVAKPEEASCPVADKFMPIFKKAKEELFARHPLPTIKGRRQDALRQFKAMRDAMPGEDSYYADLITVVEEFDDINEGSLRDILRLDLQDISMAHSRLLKIVPKQLVRNIIDKVQRMEEGLELILLAEELEEND